MSADHYATLGVSNRATAAEIRAAYLNLMRQYHPDRNRSPEAGERARSIIAAFKTLNDFDLRSHYDWDRRRARERAAALTVVPNRTLDKKAVVVGMAGAGCVVAAMAAWSMIMPQPAPRLAAAAPVQIPDADTADVDPLPPVRSAPRTARKPVVRRGETMIRMVPILPPRPSPAASRGAEQVKPALARREPPRPTINVAERKAPEPAAKRPAPAPIRVAAKVPALPARTVVHRDGDLAALDQFVMAFYGQSWRYGDARKRAALEQSHDSFAARRGACLADSCRRAAYLQLQRDVSSIVESGEPAR